MYGDEISVISFNKFKKLLKVGKRVFITDGIGYGLLSEITGVQTNCMFVGKLRIDFPKVVLISIPSENHFISFKPKRYNNGKLVKPLTKGEVLFGCEILD